MKNIYPYKDESTLIRLSKSPQSNIISIVETKTIDEATGIEITMAKTITKGDLKNATNRC